MGDCCRKVKVGDKSPRNRAGRCTTFRRGTAREIGCGRGDLLFAERGCNHYGVGCEGRFHAAAPWIIALPVARSLSARAFPLALAFGWSWPSGPASFAGSGRPKKARRAVSPARRKERGRASCRERGAQLVLVPGVTVSIKKKQQTH